MGNVAYLDRMAPYARRASQETGIPASVILAQWAIETAWGTSKGAVTRNNHGGISWRSATPPSWSTAIKADPRPASEGAYYLNYRSVDDFVSDYIHVMKGSAYTAVRAAGKTPGLQDDAYALGASPYAGGHYTVNGVQGQSVVNTIRANELWKYDHGGAVAAAPDGTVKLGSMNAADVIKGTGSNGTQYLLLMGAAALTVMAMLDA